MGSAAQDPGRFRGGRIMLMTVILGIVATQVRNSRRADRITRHALYVHDIRQAFHSSGTSKGWRLT